MLKFGETGQPFEQLGLVARLQLMLPDANHGPAICSALLPASAGPCVCPRFSRAIRRETEAKGAVHAAATRLVALDLRLPEEGFGFGLGAVLRAAVPDAAVYEGGGL